MHTQNIFLSLQMVMDTMISLHWHIVPLEIQQRQIVILN